MSVTFLFSGVAVVSLAIWIYLAFARGMFWRLRAFDDDLAAHQTTAAWPSVLAVVPARNEAATIAQAVRSLLQQNYAGQFSLIVVDDHSEDGTAQLAEDAAREAGGKSHFDLHTAAPLPSGWTGKLWGLNEAVNSPQAAMADYYWFTDADIVHAGDTLQRLVSRAEGARLELASLMVLLQAKSMAERLLIPPFLFFFLKLYPPKWIANPRRSTAGAAGGCVLLRREALERMGRFAAIRGEVIDDCALARGVKESGGRIWMGVTRASVSLRAYGSFGEIRDMIARTAFTQLGYSLLVLAGAVGGLLLTYVAPVALVFTGNAEARVLGIWAWTLMALVFLPTVRFYGLSPVWAITLPAAAVFYLCATVLSAVRYWLGRGGQWKGRVQAGNME